MAEATPMACAPLSSPDHPPTAVAAVPSSPAVDEVDILNDDVLIAIAPARPSGTIRVRLVPAGRSTPLPAEDPWAE